MSDQAQAGVATSPAFTSDLADDVARTALAMARRFAAGATLWCLAPDWLQHAEHVAVEFVHPVIMGKRALPAVAILERDPVAALRSHVRPGDLVLAVSASESPAVGAALRRGPAWGTPTVWIGAGVRPEPGLADQVLWLDEDPGLAAHTGRLVLLYHLLWELTHVCFEHPGLLGGDGDAGQDARCATCSDEAHLVEVVAGSGEETVAARGGCGIEDVSIALVEEVQPGDLLLVHAGTAINVIEHEVDRRVSPAEPSPPEDTAFLYPFIEAEERDSDGLLADLARSASEKATVSAELRAATLEACAATLQDLAGAMAERFQQGGRLFTFGNGGSSTDAATLAALFSVPPSGRPLAARCLVADRAVITALGNDVGYDLIFSRQIIAHGRPPDMAIGLSTSGNSANVMVAMAEARRRGMLTAGLAGYEGGQMLASDDVAHCLVVTSDSVHRIQETQAALGFALWQRVQDATGTPAP